jgi:cytidylate kinase
MAVITVSKEFGSGGTDVARLLAKTLKYRYVDKSLVVEVGRQLRVNADDVNEWDMESHSNWKARISKYLDIHPFKGGFVFEGPFHESSMPVTQYPGFIDTTIYKKVTKELIEELADRGDVVIVGRGGQAVLRDRPNALHVRIVCPLKERASRIMEHKVLSRSNAEALILETDRRSQHYVRHYYNTEAADPHNYHLVLNTGRMDVQEAVDAIVSCLEHLTAVTHYEATAPQSAPSASRPD